MLKINRKLQTPLVLFAISIGGIFLYQYLTFIPEYSSATTISTPIYDNPALAPIAKWDDLEYMQQMTPEACAGGNATGKQLIDSRDGKKYWVAKLKDGNCWMTQNLDLDILTGKALTIDSSDVEENWVPGSEESTILYPIPLSLTNWPKTNNINRSYDPGWYVYDEPTVQKNTCGDANGLQNCTQKGWRNVTQDSNDYDAHYLAGNYYSWDAATAGQGAKISGAGQATQSICPKGWKLPPNSGEGSYTDLLSSYGAPTLDTLKYGDQDIRMAPLYFVYGGNIESGLLRDAGNTGYYRSSTASNNSNASYLRFNTSIYPTYSDERYRGFSVRCVARANNSSETIKPTIDNPTLSVTIPKVLTLDVTDSVNIETNPNNISTGTFTASVTSNANYSISLNATSEDASATSLVNIKDNKKVAEIPTITSTTQPTIGISSWGIRKCNNLTTETCTENYKPLPTKNSTTGNPFLTSTPGNHQHLFQIGIGIGPELPSGTYTTSITVTASQN